VPLYLHHRYQLEAAAKLIGGLEFSYSVKGDGQAKPRPVAATTQVAAIRALTATLSPEFLALPRKILDLIPPHPPGYGGGEVFASDQGYGLDPQALASACAGITLDALLEPSRAARLQMQKARDPGLPGFDRVLAEIIDQSFGIAVRLETMQRELHAGLRRLVVDDLIEFADAQGVRADLRGEALLSLQSIKGQLEDSSAEKALRLGLLRSIDGFLAHPEARIRPSRKPRTPEGSPIGSRR